VWYDRSPQVALLPYFEQTVLANAYNFSLATWLPDNYTIHGTGLSTLWCPSDYGIDKIRTLTKVTGGYTPPQQTPTGLPILQAMTNYVPCVGMCGIPQDPFAPANIIAQESALGGGLGVIIPNKSTKLSSVTDGTSNTILYSERAQGISSAQAIAADEYLGMWWDSSWWAHANFDTEYGINAHLKYSGLIAAGCWWLPVEAASSMHPGGANFLFCDGSVHFLKDSINSWQILASTCDAPGITYSAAPVNTGDAIENVSGAVPGVYQKLSSRSANDIVSSDQY
jgi:prepilin-type processing-associated H-X9-DG protein